MSSLIVFAKAPVAGFVKTRLSPPLDEQDAVGLYRAFVSDVLAGAAESGAAVSLAFDAHPVLTTPPWALPWFPQGPGDLGARLSRAFDQAFARGAASVAIIGSDCPDLEPAVLRDAFVRLDAADVVLGPAEDGGYYLVGLRRPRPELFTDMPWSSSGVLERTLARLGTARVALLPRRADVDTAADLSALERRLAAGVARAPASARALAALKRAS